MVFDRVISERCPSCGASTFRNHFLLREGHHARVFVQCAHCGELVARYILHAYVDPNYSYSSALKMLQRSSHYGDSMRNIKEDLEFHQSRAKTQFDEVLERQQNEAKDGDREEKIIEMISKYGIVEDD